MALTAAETIYAKPLTFTPDGFLNELVITASNKNILRIHDGITGALIASRTLDPPFQAIDTSCGDVQNYIGIIGTPIIDPATSIMYFFSKGYKGGSLGSCARAKILANEIRQVSLDLQEPWLVKSLKTNLSLKANFVQGQYKFYAVNIPSLTDVAGFPVSLEGKPANNDPTR